MAYSIKILFEPLLSWLNFQLTILIHKRKNFGVEFYDIDNSYLY